MLHFIKLGFAALYVIPLLILLLAISYCVPERRIAEEK
jgi:hypothetical protein